MPPTLQPTTEALSAEAMRQRVRDLSHLIGKLANLPEDVDTLRRRVEVLTSAVALLVSYTGLSHEIEKPDTEIFAQLSRDRTLCADSSSQSHLD